MHLFGGEYTVMACRQQSKVGYFRRQRLPTGIAAVGVGTMTDSAEILVKLLTRHVGRFVGARARTSGRQDKNQDKCRTTHVSSPLNGNCTVEGV